MSNKPNPVAETAAMLASRLSETHRTWDGKRISAPGTVIDAVSCYALPASLASQLHRLAPACKRQAEAECNGEFFDGQRERMKWKGNDLKALEADIENAGNRLSKRIAKLNEQLKLLAVEAYRTGDPQGWTLRLRTTDPNRPLPRNGWDDECWGIS